MVDESIKEMKPLEQAGTRVSRAIHGAVLDGGEQARDVADVLHGTWLGHPLHPVLTDVTIGAWTLGAAFDAVGLFANDDFSRRVGDQLTAVGTASALPTAITGLADFSTIPKPAVTVGSVHAMANSVGLALYLLSLRDRSRGRRGRGLLFSTLALTAATAGAWLGGKLVYGERVGVDHRDDFSGLDDWTPVLDETELPADVAGCVQVEVKGKGVLLHRDGSGIHAIGSVCAHAGGPLEKGSIDGPYVECPWHQSVFDLRDGSVKHGPATLPQPSFETRVRGGMIEIRPPRGKVS
ncbi:MAG TPA: DUF2231 domain-containing protein [Longimicrobiaceae bacterium]|nr:DUF2231 domain-containing protein [Longimicrobiaceae bacterium]